MRKNLPLMTILSQSKPSSHLQAGLGKAVSWTFEVFSEHITVWGFSEPGDASPFLFFFLDGVRGRGSSWTCPPVPLQFWGRGEGLEGWSGSHVKVGPSLNELGSLGAVRGSFLPHCICRARWFNATLRGQQRSTPPALRKQFAGSSSEAVNLPPDRQWWQLRWGSSWTRLLSLSSWGCRELIPGSESASCATDYSLCAAEQVLCCQRDECFTPSEAGIQKITFFIL